MRKVFLLSGEYPTLPKEEVRAVLEALNVEYRTRMELDSVLILDLGANSEVNAVLRERLAFTRSFGELISIVKPEEFPDKLVGISPPSLIGRFRATAVRIKGCCREIRTSDVEKEVGAWILRANPKAKVNLENPSTEIVAVLTSGVIVIFLKEEEVDRTMFKIKEVAARPFVHPASMRPTLARAMVNLARTRPRDTVLDPFVGVGGIALEVLSVGAKLLGADINKRTVVEAKNNLIAYGFLEGFRLFVGDALNLELGEKVDRIVTDPPYGRMSPSIGYEARELVKRFVRKAPDYLKSGGWMVISVPREYLRKEDLAESGFEPLQTFDIREHRSLTRRVWVARLR